MKRKKLIAAISISLALVIVLSVFALPGNVWQNRIDKLENISVHEAYAIITYRLNQTYMVILDVRAQAEFNTGHIANAINIPHTALEANLSDPANCPLTGHKGDLILVYCLYGGRSSIGCEILAIAGFTNIYNMIGGITQWRNPVWNYTVVVTPPPTYTTISATEAHLMVTSGSPTYGKCNLVVDVRSQAEYDAQHIVNSTIPPILHAINNYYDNEAGFESRIAPLIGHENDPIIVYCVDNTCSKSTLACQYLVDHNWRKVYKLDNGIYAWKLAGYPTAPTPPSSSLFSDGFESGSLPGAWTGTITTSGETLEVVSTPFFEGLYSCHAKSVTAGHRAYAYKTFSSANDTLYMRAYVGFAADLVSGDSGVGLLEMASSSNSLVFRLRIRRVSSSNYYLEVGVPGIGYITSTPFSIGLNTWYAVELQGHVDASAGWFKVLWDGAVKIDKSGVNTGTTMLQRANVGIVYTWESTTEIYVDSVTVSNDPISP